MACAYRTGSNSSRTFWVIDHASYTSPAMTISSIGTPSIGFGIRSGLCSGTCLAPARSRGAWIASLQCRGCHDRCNR